MVTYTEKRKAAYEAARLPDSDVPEQGNFEEPDFNPALIPAAKIYADVALRAKPADAGGREIKQYAKTKRQKKNTSLAHFSAEMPVYILEWQRYTFIPNPKIAALRTKLARHKLEVSEEIFIKKHGEFVKLTTKQ